MSVQQKQLLWAKVTASKALKENTEIAKRIVKMEELGQGITLLEKMWKAIGPLFDDESKPRVRTLYAALPDFTTFDTAVDVIDEDAENEDIMPTTTKKRPFELEEVESKQEVDSSLLKLDNEKYFEAGTQWSLDMVPEPASHSAPESYEEHVSVNDEIGNLVAVAGQSKMA